MIHSVLMVQFGSLASALQSGIHRGTFVRPLEGEPVGFGPVAAAPPLANTRALFDSMERGAALTQRASRSAHEGAVTGVACDSCNR